MGAILNFPQHQAAGLSPQPTVLTQDVIARIGLCNRVSRRLRQLGYRVVDEDACPNDQGSPIIEINPMDIRTKLLENLASVMVTLPGGVTRIQIDGVRVFWRRAL